MRDLSLIGVELRREIKEMLPKQKESSSKSIKAIKATYYGIFLEDEICTISEQFCNAKKRSWKVLSEHNHRQLDADVIKQAQSKSVRTILLVPEENCKFRFCVYHWYLYD